MSNDILEQIEDLTNFFTEREIKSKDFAISYICDLLTDKFLNGIISSDEENVKGIFNEVEFTDILHKITIQNALDGLKEKGIINSFEQNGEEHYFLTEHGKMIGATMFPKK